MSSPRRTSSRKFKTRPELRKDDMDPTLAPSDEKSTQNIRPGAWGLVDRFNSFPPATRMYYVKLLFGAISGILVASLPFNIPAGSWVLGIGLAVIFLLITCVIVRFGLKISKDDLSNRRLFLSGTFSFVVIFLMSWVVIWQLGNVNNDLVNLIIGQ